MSKSSQERIARLERKVDRLEMDKRHYEVAYMDAYSFLMRLWSALDTCNGEIAEVLRNAISTYNAVDEAGHQLWIERRVQRRKPGAKRRRFTGRKIGIDGEFE